MSRLLVILTSTKPLVFHAAMLMLRLLFALELIAVHGLKKLDESPAEVPNPFGLPEMLNYSLALLSNTLFPVLVAVGFLTRLSVLPTLLVTLTGYFVVHAHDELIVKDTPFMYSLVALSILLLGPGRYSVDHLIGKKLRNE